MSHKTKHKKNRPDYRRIAAAVLAILIALVMVLGLFQPLFASERPDVAITDGQIGFNRMYRMGGYTPFIVTLENSGNADFEGILRIMVDVSHIERERSFVSYSREVRLSAGEQRTIETIIPLVTHRRTHRAVLVDNSGNTIASRTIFASAVDTHQVMAGMLTDNRQAASRMRWLRLDDQAWEASIINQRLVFLDETNFPSSIQTLNGFNIIIADDFNPAHLSQTQLDALNKWVLEGGVAAFGSTGGFERSFLQGLSGEPINDTHNTIYGATYNSFIYSHGLGTVIIHEFPLVYGTVHDSFPGEGLLSYLYRRHIIMNTTPIARFATETLMLTENLPSFNSPQLPIIMIIVGVYALAIGSVLYVLLKKRDKRELAIYIIPAAAVGVTAVISIIGLGSGYQEPITSTVTRLTLSGEGTSAVAESVTGVHSPSSGDITVVLANDAPLRFEAMQHWGIMPLDPSRSSARVTERNEADIRIGPNGEISNITYLNRASWDGGHFSQTSDVELAGELQGNFRFEGSTLVGTLRNNTGLDLYDVIVGVASTFERHDFLANGHELEISMALSAALPFFSHWNIVEEVFPFRGLGHDTTPEEGRNLQFKRDVMNTLLSGNTLSPVFSPITRSPVSTDSTVTTADEQAGLRLLPDEQRWMLQDEPYTYRDIVYGFPEALPARPVTRIEVGAPVNVHIIAFNYSDVAGMGINVGGIPAKAIHTNFLIANQPMQLSGSQNFDLPRGIVDYTALETDTSIQMMPFSHEVSIREAGFVEFIYDLGARIDQLHVNWEVHSHMMGVNKTIFNHSTGEWEHIRHTEYTDDVADYVRDGTLRLRVDVQMSNWITPPAISVKGGR